MAEMNSLAAMIREAGVVGAGGAGFPAHVKAGSAADCVIANGAECEPLIHKDYELMVHYAERVVRGLRLLMDSTGAKEGILGVKEKNAAAVSALQSAIGGGNIRLHLLGDFYPSGDEYILVYEATGRLIPPQGIPLNVGVVVNNVETLYNIAAAAEGQPVTGKFVTVAGAVRKPVSFIAPIGMSYRDAIELAAGGATVPEFSLFVGGIMMGKPESNLGLPITKTTAGLVVLPLDHTLVGRRNRPAQSMHRIGKSACDQCSYCTELCPRYILGYDVQPHKVMRSLSFTATGEHIWNQYAQLCCACGLCTLYACPESLYPKEACDRAKHDLRERGIPWSGRTEVVPHAMYEGRRTPLHQLVRRLGVEEYDRPSRFLEPGFLEAEGAGREKDEQSGRAGAQKPAAVFRPARVEIPLSQHTGARAVPVARVGQRVSKGDCIGEIPEGKLGARVHASIDGVVTGVGDTVVIEQS